MLLMISVGFGFNLVKADAASGINQQLNYQGKMTNSAGVQVADQSWNFKFEIWDAETNGNLLWTERWTSTSTQLTTVNGIFSAALGSLGQSDSLSDVDWNSDSLYLQVDLNADLDVEADWEESFGARKRITSAAYAFNADMVDGIHATSTAAVANYLIALNSQGILDLFGSGVSSTAATTTYTYYVPQVTAPDAYEGRLYYDSTNNVLKFYNGNAWISIGSVTSAINFSASSYDGVITNSGTTGYEAADDICNAEFAGSHLCSSNEIGEYLVNNATSTLSRTTFWVKEYAPGYTANANDCSGYTDNTSTYLGSFGDNTGGVTPETLSFWLTNCSVSKKLSCCQ